MGLAKKAWEEQTAREEHREKLWNVLEELSYFDSGDISTTDFDPDVADEWVQSTIAEAGDLAMDSCVVCGCYFLYSPGFESSICDSCLAERVASDD